MDSAWRRIEILIASKRKNTELCKKIIYTRMFMFYLVVHNFYNGIGMELCTEKSYSLRSYFVLVIAAI